MPFIDGQYFGAPGVLVNVNDSALLAPPSVGGQGLLLIGSATDGEPNTAVQLTGPGNAVQVLKGGDLLQAALLAFAPSGSVPPASAITVIRVDPATQATATIANATTGTAIALTTTSYGSVANSSKFEVTAGTTSGYRITEATDFTGPGGLTFQAVAPNQDISLIPLTIQYTGTGTTPTYTVSDTDIVLTATGTDTGGTITFTSTMTVQQLVNQINQLPGWVATVTDPNPNDLLLPVDVVPGTTTASIPALLDNVTTAAAVSTTAGTPVTAHVAAMVRWINQQDAFFTAVREAAAVSLTTASAYTYATGGSNGTVTNTNWTNAFTTAQGLQNIGLLSPVSSSESIWVMADTHCHYMASQGQPRRCYVGDALGASLATETGDAASVNSNRTSIVWPGLKGTDYNGNATTFAPYLVAAQVASARAGLAVDQALTNKAVYGNGLEQTVTPATVAQGLAGGVIVLTRDSTGSIVISQDRTTWLQTTAYDKVENSTGMVVDTITEALNAVLRQFVGQPLDSATLANASHEVFATLLSFYPGYLTVKPKQSDVTLQASGESITGNASAAIVTPTNYIVLTLNAYAASLS